MEKYCSVNQYPRMYIRISTQDSLYLVAELIPLARAERSINQRFSGFARAKVLSSRASLSRECANSWLNS